MSYLSDQLREHGPSFELDYLCDEAADALDAKDARIAELEARIAALLETHVLPALNVVRSASADLAQCDALTDERIESVALSYCGHVAGAGYDTLRFECVEDRNNFVRELAAAPLATPASEAQGAEEPDCWAILTPNGSRLVSPDEAKGRLDAYPLYSAPPAQTAPPALTDAARDAFIRDVAAQTPEKPDYWSLCGQCGHNMERAQDLLDAAQSASEGNNAG